MSRPIATGQTVPVPFTLSESPDSTPTVAVYESPAGAARSLIGSGMVTVLSGLAYDAHYTVPSDAEHGTAFHLLVSVTIAGETTTHWLDGGTVELWASQASVDDNATAIAALPTDAEIWSYPTRRLTMTVDEVVDAMGDTPTITIRRGDTVAVQITELGSLAGVTDLWITGKSNTAKRDDEAIFQTSASSGLIVFRGSTPSDPSDGSVSIDDEAAGDITLHLTADRAADLCPIEHGVWDVQAMTGASITTLRSGRLRVSADVTRTTG